MKNKKIRVAAAGDILIMKTLPKGYQDADRIRAYMEQADIRMGNLEATITDGTCYGSAYSGGTWLTADEECLAEVARYGFNMLGWANNHTMDYSYDGLKQTQKNIKKYGFAQAGVGDNLYEATRPAIMDTEGGRVAIFDFCSTFEDAARAGEQTPRQPGRPGLNPLRFRTVYRVTKAHAAMLQEIAEATKINELRESHRKQGFVAPLPEGTTEFNGAVFQTVETPEEEGRFTIAHPGDVRRMQEAIREALYTCDAAIVMVHSHEVRSDSDTEPDYFLEEFAHACIDAGACAVVGGGTHQLKGIEMYRECPIFYCLGNFIFENEYVRLLPADYMEKYGLPADTSAAVGIATRSAGAKKSLYTMEEIYRTALPYFEIEDGKCTHLELLPVELGMHRPQYEKNIPYIADEKTAMEITDYLNDASRRYRLEWKYENGRIVRK